MTAPKHPSPLTRTQVVDLYFLEHRAKLLDLAAFLDRCDAVGVMLWYDLTNMFGYTPSSEPQWSLMQAEVARVRHRRCIMGWYLAVRAHAFATRSQLLC